MRMDDSRESQNVEDRRSSGPSLGRGGSIGIGTIVLALVAMYFGVDPSVVLQMADGPATETSAPAGTPIPRDDPKAQFVARILGETEDTWNTVFAEQTNGAYQNPKLVLYTGATPTACGTGQAAMGPFYCPGDMKVYLDMAFFDEMKRKLNAPGEFAQAYVIAHEIGHHVQKQLGTLDRINAQRQRLPEVQANRLSVQIELQADCYAGIWAKRADAARHILEPGDIEQGMNAASAVGDDTLQRKAQGRVVPDAFTHGSSAQRVKWFKQGYEQGKLKACDTFSAQAS